MLSILTGVISEGMIEKGNSHKEEMRFQEERKKQAFMKKLRDHFLESDIDGDGQMTLDEFGKSLPQMMHMFEVEGFQFGIDDLTMVFGLVDFDHGGTVELEEFLQGMTSFTANVGDLPLIVLRLQSNIFLHLNQLETKVETKLDGFDARCMASEDRLQSIEEKIAMLVSMQGPR